MGGTPDGGGKVWRRMALHGVAAGVFFFVLHRYGLHSSLETSLTWAGALAAVAGLVAWKQATR